MQMLRIPLKFLLASNVSHIRQLTTSSRALSAWDIWAATVVHRSAVTVKPMNVFDRSYYETLQQIEAEESLLSDHEIEWEKEQKRLSKQKTGQSEVVMMNLLRDQYDEWQKELAAFQKKYAGVHKAVTDERSLERHLDEAIFLITDQILGSSSHWLFPQTKWKEGETLRQTAERAIGDVCGEGLSFQVLGNAPVAFYKYKYPAKDRSSSNTEGAKVFFFKAKVKNGAVSSDAVKSKKAAKDFKWATYDELRQILPKRYSHCVLPSIYYIPQVNFTKFLDSSVVEQQQDEQDKKERSAVERTSS